MVSWNSPKEKWKIVNVSNFTGLSKKSLENHLKS